MVLCQNSRVIKFFFSLVKQLGLFDSNWRYKIPKETLSEGALNTRVWGKFTFFTVIAIYFGNGRNRNCLLTFTWGYSGLGLLGLGCCQTCGCEVCYIDVTMNRMTLGV